MSAVSERRHPQVGEIMAKQSQARKTTGPKTPEGKARSSQNAVKHGMRARTLLVHGEEATLYEAFRDALFEQWQPLGDSERSAVQRMAELQWRLRRFAPMEAELLESLRDPNLEYGGFAAAFLGNEGADGRGLERLRRYETSMSRELHREQRALMQLQRLRDAWPPPHMRRQEEVEGEEGDEGAGAAVSTEAMWCEPVAEAPVLTLSDDDGPVTVTVERVILDPETDEAEREQQRREAEGRWAGEEPPPRRAGGDARATNTGRDSRG
jgi:hypothetical protein